MKILLPAYRSIDWIVKAYAHMHELYWDAPVVLLAEEDYSDGQFECAIPPWKEDATWVDGDVPNEIPGHHFTDVLFWYLKQIEDTHVIIMLADYLLSAPVDIKSLIQLQEYMELHKEVMRGHIDAGGGWYKLSKQTDLYKDIEIWEDNFLPSSLTPAIWNVDLLQRLMVHRDSAHGLESKGRDIFYKMAEEEGIRSVAAKPGMVSYINCIRGGDMSHMVMTHEIYKEVKQYINISTLEFS